MAFAFLPFERTCLRESLILCRMYQRRHHHVELRIGVRIENGTLKAQASTRRLRLERPTPTSPLGRRSRVLRIALFPR